MSTLLLFDVLLHFFRNKSHDSLTKTHLTNKLNSIYSQKIKESDKSSDVNESVTNCSGRQVLEDDGNEGVEIKMEKEKEKLLTYPTIAEW